MMRLLGLVFFLISCQLSPASAQTQVQFTPNPKLLISWEEFVKSGKYAESPYLVKFSTSSKNLWFIAAKHSNSVESATFELIKKAFTEFNPKALIIEGVEKGPDLSAESYKFLTKDTDLVKTTFWTNGEVSYATAFAIKQKVACVSGEPSEKYIRTNLDKRFTLKDMFGLYMLRQIPEVKRNNPNEKIDFKKWYATFARHVSKETTVSLSLSEFKSWYEEKNIKKFDFDKMDSEESAPKTGKNALFTQEISYSIGILRNTAILYTIADMLNRYDKVLIVYGSGHFEEQVNALEAMLGKAEIIKN